MQRAFSMFPDGLPGVGLLLLRAATGAVLVGQGIAYFLDWVGLPAIGLAIALLSVLIGAALLIGYLTPIAGILAGLISIGFSLSLFPVPSPDLFETRLAASFATVIAIALVCVGPGAFSIDARLFGRREIVIPSSTSKEL